jgi:hypothetical protein
MNRFLLIEIQVSSSGGVTTHSPRTIEGERRPAGTPRSPCGKAPMSRPAVEVNIDFVCNRHGGA